MYVIRVGGSTGRGIKPPPGRRRKGDPKKKGERETKEQKRS